MRDFSFFCHCLYMPLLMCFPLVSQNLSLKILWRFHNFPNDDTESPLRLTVFWAYKKFAFKSWQFPSLSSPRISFQAFAFIVWGPQDPITEKRCNFSVESNWLAVRIVVNIDYPLRCSKKDRYRIIEMIRRLVKSHLLHPSALSAGSFSTVYSQIFYPV